MLPMCVKFLENVQEDADYEVDSDDEFDEEVHEKSLKKDEEVYDVQDDQDVRNSMTKDVNF